MCSMCANASFSSTLYGRVTLHIRSAMASVIDFDQAELLASGVWKNVLIAVMLALAAGVTGEADALSPTMSPRCLLKWVARLVMQPAYFTAVRQVLHIATLLSRVMSFL